MIDADGWFVVVQELVTVAAETLKVLLEALYGWMSVGVGGTFLARKCLWCFYPLCAQL